jgi:hypothetical protein
VRDLFDLDFYNLLLHVQRIRHGAFLDIHLSFVHIPMSMG